MRRRTFIVIGLCAGLVIGCVATTALAQGGEAAGVNWPALNAIVNFTNIVGTAVLAAVALFVRWLRGQVANMTTLLNDIREWQTAWTKAAEANLVKLAMEQKELAVGCIAIHGAPPPGRPREPQPVVFEWPAPQMRRRTDQN